MTPEEKQKKLGEDYAEYLAESAKREAAGENPIGTFSSWSVETGKNKIKIPMSREEYFGK
jgi:hypothetical protein